MADHLDTLGPEGRAAFERAAPYANPELHLEALLRFARAVEHAESVRAEWLEQGRPLLYTRPSGALMRHPLLEVMRDAEADAARWGRALGLEPRAAAPRRGPGRPPGAASAADRKHSPAPPVVTLSNRFSELNA